MSFYSEKRTNLRVEIPESTAYAKSDKWYRILTIYEAPGRLIDLSQSGAGFETLLRIKKDERLRVKIDIPGEQKLILKGHVRWAEPVMWNGKTRVGVQFTSYGRQKPYNSPFALATLQVLQEKYGRMFNSKRQDQGRKK
jgi:hypothetical protein